MKSRMTGFSMPCLGAISRARSWVWTWSRSSTAFTARKVERIVAATKTIRKRARKESRILRRMPIPHHYRGWAPGCRLRGLFLDLERGLPLGPPELPFLHGGPLVARDHL